MSDFSKILRDWEITMQKLFRNASTLIIIGIFFIIGLISGVVLKAEILSLSDLIQAFSALALTYFAFVQIAAREPIVFARAEDWTHLIIENASDYPIFDIWYDVMDATESFGLSSSKIKIIYSKKSEKVELSPDFQGVPSVVHVTIVFRTKDMEGPLHQRKNEVLLREPGSLF
jgi:hypothetical protein